MKISTEAREAVAHYNDKRLYRNDALYKFTFIYLLYLLLLKTRVKIKDVLQGGGHGER